MKKIGEQMNNVKGKIGIIRSRAEDAKQKIKQIVQQALKDLYEVEEERTSILKADRLELARQYKECEFMSGYLKIQLDGSDPLEFLRLSKGHELLRDMVQSQPAPASDVETEIIVNDKLSIKRDDKKVSGQRFKSA